MRRYAVPIKQTNWLPGLHPHRLSWEVKHSKTIRSNFKFCVGFFFFFFTIVNGPGTLLPLTVNIWKSHIWTADKEVNMKTIFAVMNTAWAVVKIKPYFCTGIAEVMGSKAVQAWIFFRPYFHCCSSGVYYREDRFHIHYFLCNFEIFILLISSIFNSLECNSVKWNSFSITSCRRHVQRCWVMRMSLRCWVT